MRLSVHSFECRPPLSPSGTAPPPQHCATTPDWRPELRAPLDRHRHHLGRYAAVPGLLSPSPELPGEAGTITPPPNQIRPGSSSADWGFGGEGAQRVRNCFLWASQIGHNVSPSSACSGSPNQGCSPRVAPRSTLQGRSTDQAQLSLLLRRGPSRPRSSGLPSPSRAGPA